MSGAPRRDVGRDGLGERVGSQSELGSPDNIEEEELLRGQRRRAAQGGADGADGAKGEAGATLRRAGSLEGVGLLHSRGSEGGSSERLALTRGGSVNSVGEQAHVRPAAPTRTGLVAEGGARPAALAQTGSTGAMARAGSLPMQAGESGWRMPGAPGAGFGTRVGASVSSGTSQAGMSQVGVTGVMAMRGSLTGGGGGAGLMTMGGARIGRQRRSSLLSEKEESATLVFDAGGTQLGAEEKKAAEGLAAAGGGAMTMGGARVGRQRRSSLLSDKEDSVSLVFDAGGQRLGEQSEKDKALAAGLGAAGSVRSIVRRGSIQDPGSALLLAQRRGSIESSPPARRGSVDTSASPASLPQSSAQAPPTELGSSGAGNAGADANPAAGAASTASVKDELSGRADRLDSVGSLASLHGSDMSKRNSQHELLRDKDTAEAAGFVRHGGEGPGRAGNRFSIRRVSTQTSTQNTVDSLLAQQRELMEAKKKEREQVHVIAPQRCIFFSPDMGGDKGARPGAPAAPGAARLAGEHSLGFVSFSERQALRNRLVATQRRVSRNAANVEPSNFYDVVEADVQPVSAGNGSDRLAGKVTESAHFQRLVLALIVLNTLLAVLYTFPYFEQNYGMQIDQVDNVLLTVFMAEMLLKMRHQKKAFWRDPWNRFDFVLIAISVLGTMIRDVYAVGTAGSAFLRVMRAFRSLRILGAVKELQIVVNTFLKSLVELTNIVAMIMLLIFMFAILGLQLFGQYVPERFGTLTLSFYSLFILITQDGWVAIYDELAAATAPLELGPATQFVNHIYFVLFITIGAWIFINVTSGITVTNWQLYVNEMKALELARYHAITQRSMRSADTTSEARPVTRDNVDAEVWPAQVPLASAAALGNISVQKLENYMLVVAALDRNLKEFHQLRKALCGQLEIVRKINAEAEEEQKAGAPPPGKPGDKKKLSSSADVLTVLQTTDAPLRLPDSSSAYGGGRRNSLVERIHETSHSGTDSI
jgi:cation channel sperm-associated protein 4